MDSSQLGVLLKEFEPFFKCSLKPDVNDSCLIKMGIGITLQIELDRTGALLIGSIVATLPLGRYRDNVIKEALKSNENSLPSKGLFGFSQKTQHLILFLKMNPASLTSNQIQQQLPPFILKAKKWSESIAKGEIPSNESENKNEITGLFGLISKENT